MAAKANFRIWECLNAAQHRVALTVTLALLVGVGVVEKSFPIMSPGHAAKLDSLQAVLQRQGVFNPQEADLHPVWTTGAGAIRQVLPVLRERIALKWSEEQRQNINKRQQRKLTFFI